MISDVVCTGEEESLHDCDITFGNGVERGCNGTQAVILRTRVHGHVPHLPQ